MNTHRDHTPASNLAVAQPSLFDVDPHDLPGPRPCSHDEHDGDTATTAPHGADAPEEQAPAAAAAAAPDDTGEDFDLLLEPVRSAALVDFSAKAALALVCDRYGRDIEGLAPRLRRLVDGLDTALADDEPKGPAAFLGALPDPLTRDGRALLTLLESYGVPVCDVWSFGKDPRKAPDRTRPLTPVLRLAIRAGAAADTNKASALLVAVGETSGRPKELSELRRRDLGQTRRTVDLGGVRGVAPMTVTLPTWIRDDQIADGLNGKSEQDWLFHKSSASDVDKRSTALQVRFADMLKRLDLAALATPRALRPATSRSY